MRPMVSLDFEALAPFWLLFTRIGEAQITLPAAAVTAIGLWLRPDARPLAWRWLWALACAIGLTTVTKVAFIGWGIGWEAIDFTGISGHTMFATAIYPVLFLVFVSGTVRHGVGVALTIGYGLALLVGFSRLAVGAHSPSEVVAGLVVGASASVWPMLRSGLRVQWNWPWVPVVMLLWMAWTPFTLPPSQSHSLVTRLALTLSGHDTPFHRVPHGHPTREVIGQCMPEEAPVSDAVKGQAK